MMREILGVAQAESDSHRRWFHDEYFDLFVWQDDASAITSFQLCYGIDSSEQALEWRLAGGFFHDGMKPGAPDTGKTEARRTPNAARATDAMTSRFVFAARALPEDIRAAVTSKIREYAEKAPAVPTRRRLVRRAAWQQKEPASNRPPLKSGD
ncbi:MAG: hypothetical protein ABIS45_05580 [Burkholderiales bacterium]